MHDHVLVLCEARQSMADLRHARMSKTELVEIQCGSCGVWHAIPTAMHANCLEEGGFWHCPNGHSRGYKEGRREREAIRRERDQLKQRIAQIEDDARRERDRLLGEKAKAEKEAAKLRKRAKGGACPCCNRTFQNMSRHMKMQHPEFATDNVVKLKA